jgi:hypothetical protein
MTGGTFTDGHRVSAIIFPLRTQLYPANARGLLQVIQEVEARKDVDLSKPFLRGTNYLNREELEELERHKEINSYRFSNYQDKYRRYCELAQQFRCDMTYSARDYIGGLNMDWHPLGLAQRDVEKDPCFRPDPNYCAISDWKSAKSALLPEFGTRAFFIRNQEINAIPGRMLMDFGEPVHQLIPDIGLRPPSP